MKTALVFLIAFDFVLVFILLGLFVSYLNDRMVRKDKEHKKKLLKMKRRKIKKIIEGEHHEEKEKKEEGTESPKDGQKDPVVP